MELLRSPRTAVHLVTILEEMPVQETSDGIAELRAAGLPVGGVVVNLVRPQALSASAPTTSRSSCSSNRVSKTLSFRRSLALLHRSATSSPAPLRRASSLQSVISAMVGMA